MWWFLKKESAQTPAIEASASPRARAEEQLLAQVPDLGAPSHDVAIKIWLPALVAHTLKSVTDYEGVSQSSWVRSQLTSYVYGEVAVLVQQIRADKKQILFARGFVDRGARLPPR